MVRRGDDITTPSNDEIFRNRDVVLKDGANRERIRLDAQSGDARFKLANGSTSIHLDASGANLYLGGNGPDGDIVCFPGGADSHNLQEATLHVNGARGELFVGGGGQGGDVVTRNRDGNQTIHLDGEASSIATRDAEGKAIAVIDDDAQLTLGGGGRRGEVHLKSQQGHVRVHLGVGGTSASNARVFVDGAGGNVWLGGNGSDGDVLLKATDGKVRVHLSVAGSADSDARISLDGQHGNAFLGGNGADGDLFVRNADGVNTIHIDGDAGDITFANADCAEEFDVAGTDRIDAGTVVVLDDDGNLRESAAAYDTRVAGVVSGAGGYRPGIVLDRQPSSTPRIPVALVGKVFCKVDAQHAPVQVGDLLTTSPTPGHAMKAEDPAKAFGAVIGKALRPLAEGTAIIPVLVALQ